MLDQREDLEGSGGSGQSSNVDSTDRGDNTLTKETVSAIVQSAVAKFQNSLRDTPVAQWTPAWNYMHAALPLLIDDILKEL